MKNKNMPIGFFDSGVGGLSVLKETIKLLPNEDYIYFGDSKNAPIGDKTIEEVKTISFNIVKELLNRNVKAIVVACNTATSAAIDDLREEYKDLIIVGTEPALKPASLSEVEGSIVVMATNRTLSEKKFNDLMEITAKKRNVIKMPCPGLVELIEGGNRDSNETIDFLKEKFKDINLKNISGVVLGCTHYPFVKHQLKKVLGDVNLYDGSSGVANRLKHELESNNLLNDKIEAGNVEILNSSNNPSLINLSYELLKSDH